MGRSEQALSSLLVLQSLGRPRGCCWRGGTSVLSRRSRRDLEIHDVRGSETLPRRTSEVLEYDHNYPRRRQTSPEGLRFLAEMDVARWIKHGSGPGKFQEILMGFHHFNATNHRDKVYALLGLASDTNDTALASKYGLDVEDVYFNTARYLLLRINQY
jgi:hypothetical protein